MATIGELIASRRLVTIAPEDSILDALRKSTHENVSHLIVTEGRRLLGVCCICDLDMAESSSSVRACMNKSPVTIGMEADVSAAVALMSLRNVSCLPVLMQGELCGVVTRRDLRSLGLFDSGSERCSACGSSEHVRCIHDVQNVGLCLECFRRSEPPDADDELGGG